MKDPTYREIHRHTETHTHTHTLSKLDRNSEIGTHTELDGITE